MGIKQFDLKHHKSDIFKMICQHLNISIEHHHIANMSRPKPNILIVEFTNYEQKREILLRTGEAGIMFPNLIKHASDDRKNLFQISISNHYTRHYLAMVMVARAAFQNDLVKNWKMTKHGLYVTPMNNARGKCFLSKNELDKYIDWLQYQANDTQRY